VRWHAACSITRMRRTVWCFATVLAAACGNPAETPDASTVPDGPPAIDAGPTRRYHLASTGVQLLLDDGLQLTPADLATDADAVSVHQDFYGVPWDAFLADTAPPAAWVATIDQLAADAAATGRPVFLSLSPTYGADRRRLAARVVADPSTELSAGGGGFSTDEEWKPVCYDLRVEADGPALRAAFARYTTWMVDRFAPRWVNVGIELNLFWSCGAAWEGMVDLERDAYAAAKAAAPGAVVFPSIQIDHLYGRSDGSCPAPMTPDQCFEAHYAGLARLERDRFAISTYPYMQSGIAAPADIPSDWFTRAADRAGEAIVIAETGWLATPAAGDLNGTCITAIDCTATEQAAYLDRLVAEALARNMDLVTWWSNRDVVTAAVMTDCPCDFDASWCALVDLFRSIGGDDPTAQFYGEMLLKIFGTMGIREYDGTPRQPIFDRWTAARALPLDD
jgi:hypothetical protein